MTTNYWEMGVQPPSEKSCASDTPQTMDHNTIIIWTTVRRFNSREQPEQ
jgi:hypothetical protein